MRLRVFTAPDMASAMAAVREALGESAVIIATSTDKAKNRVTLTAALEEDISDAITPAQYSWLEDFISLLRYHGVPETLAGALVYKVRHAQPSALPHAETLDAPLLAALMRLCFAFTPLEFTAQRVMLIGPPGIGKTLTIAKLATAAAMRKVPLMVITTDTKRAGGVQQLAAFTDILQLPLHVAASAEELASHLEATSAGHCVLIDSAGCNPYDRNDLRELDGLLRVPGFEPVLALQAGMDAHEAADAVRAYAFPGIRRLVATRADATRRFGSLLAAASATPLAFSHVSDSSSVVEELTPFTAESLAHCLLRHRL